ncbi:hypothetical protein [Sphingomonas kyungheensis]|uniref:Uncharacterized protein n=1 Tax=Sphingomonas kyungheensis TaxID=1069987 RepID=A0ABU8H466_9SPHN
MSECKNPKDEAIIHTSPDIGSLVQLCAANRARPRRVTWIEVPFADGVYRFHLQRAQIQELERKCSYQAKNGEMIPLGIGAIFSRVAKGRSFLPTGEVDWSAITQAELLASEICQMDCVETIRLALIGGNRGIVDGEELRVGPDRARQLVDTYVVGQPVEDAWHYAFASLGALMYGVAAPDEQATEDMAL